ncbi:hypothetical protein CS542_10270, partial [Pedobacter sp. IW39]
RSGSALMVLVQNLNFPQWNYIGAPVYLFNQSNWIIENLEVSNYSATRGDVFRQVFLFRIPVVVTSNIIRNNAFVQFQ